MSREIKFRCWHKQLKKFVEILQLSYNENGVFALICSVDGKSDMPVFLDDIKLMQFTGIKDKNGKEIFEGDVLEWDCGRITVVDWNGFCAMFDHTGLNTKGIPRPLYDRPYLLSKVIGNVFNNPDLIDIKGIESEN